MQKRKGVGEAARMEIEELPGSFVPPFWALLVGGRDSCHPAVSDMERERVKEDEA